MLVSDQDLIELLFRCIDKWRLLAVRDIYDVLIFGIPKTSKSTVAGLRYSMINKKYYYALGNSGRNCSCCRSYLNAVLVYVQSTVSK